MSVKIGRPQSMRKRLLQSPVCNLLVWPLWRVLYPVVIHQCNTPRVLGVYLRRGGNCPLLGFFCKIAFIESANSIKTIHLQSNSIKLGFGFCVPHLPVSMDFFTGR